MNNTKKTLYIIAVFGIILTFALLWMFVSSNMTVFLIIGIIMLIISYQLTMRLIVSVICEALFERGLSYRSELFGVSDTERVFYAKTGMRKFKKRLPPIEGTEELKLSNRSAEDILAASCEIELNHEIALAASFLPLILSAFFGNFPLFLAGTIAAAVWDLVHIAVHRYNRPRLIEVSEKQRRRFFKKLDLENEVTEKSANGDTPENRGVPENNDAEPADVDTLENDKEDLDE